MQYDLDVLFSNRKALATIYFPTEGTYDAYGNVVNPPPVYALLEHDFQFHVQGIYNGVDPGQTSAAQQLSNMQSALAGGAQRVIQSVQQTLQRFNGHSSPQIQIPITIVKYKDSVNILDTVGTLLSAPAGTYNNTTLKAPYNYGHAGVLDSYLGAEIAADVIRGATNAVHLTDANNISNVYNNISSLIYGTWTVRIADYFIASDLILVDSSATVSKETVQGTNEPLYATVNLTFTTAYLPDARTIKGWFLPKLADTDPDSFAASLVAGTNGNRSAPL